MMRMFTWRHGNRFATGQGDPARELIDSFEFHEEVSCLFQDSLFESASWTCRARGEHNKR